VKSEKHKYEQIIVYITYSGEGERAEEGGSVEGKTRDWQFAKSDEYIKFVFGYNAKWIYSVMSIYPSYT